MPNLKTTVLLNIAMDILKFSPSDLPQKSEPPTLPAMLSLLVLHSLAASPLAKGQSKFLGNVVGASVPPSFDTYWNQVTTETGGRWNVVESTRGRFNFALADTAANHSKRAGIPLIYHALIYGADDPTWASRLTPAEQKSSVDEFIKTSGARYAPEFVEVVANPVHHPSGIRAALGGDGNSGYDWVIYLFKAAREAFPKSKLLLTEYDLISTGTTISTFVRIVNILKNQKLIDAIGVHIESASVARLTNTTISASLTTLGGTALPVYITGIETAASEAAEVAVIERLFPPLWHHAAVKGITIWGYIPALLSAAGEEREALRWLKAYLDSSAGKV
jgi:endo-1,4-beta-xylanase